MEVRLSEIMKDYLYEHHVSPELINSEMCNLVPPGFGVESSKLSMTAHAIRISEGTTGKKF